SAAARRLSFGRVGPGGLAGIRGLDVVRVRAAGSGPRRRGAVSRSAHAGGGDARPWAAEKSTIAGEASRASSRRGGRGRGWAVGRAPGQACTPPSMTLVSTALPPRQSQVVVVTGPDVPAEDDAAQASTSRHTPMTSSNGA